MKVYVDELQIWPNGRGVFVGEPSCHLLAENHSPEAIVALHEMAGRLGCPRWWAKLPPAVSWPLYELSAKRRKLALAQGAIPITARQSERMRRTALRGKPTYHGFDD